MCAATKLAVRTITAKGPAMPAPRSTALLLAPLLAAAALVPTAWAQESYEERWIRLADAHAAAVATEPGTTYEAQLLEAHGAIARHLEERCGRAGRRSGMASFQAVLVLASDGRVEELLPMPRSPHFRCFEREMTRQRYPAPPSAPFPYVVRFNLPTG